MVKSFITVLIASAFIVLGAIAENYFVTNKFKKLEMLALVNQQKALEETLTSDDVAYLQELWIESKQTLHIWIPHNEIKEIELWISEAVACVHNKKYPDAYEKLEVVAELCQQTPRTFAVHFSNIL